MDLIDLGNSGLRVGRIGLGTVKIGRLDGLKYPNAQKAGALPSDEGVLDLLGHALDLGVNLIDTAPAYGVAEERLGQLLYRVAPRAGWVLCGKVGEEWDGAASRYDFSPRAIRASLERSLRRLNTGALDLALLHGSGQVDERTLLERGEALGALHDAQRAGLVRVVGVSAGTPAGALLAVQRAGVVMLTLNQDDRAQAPAIDAAAARGVGVLIKKPLASGRAPPDSLRAVLGYRGVHAAVVGTTSPEHLRQAVAAAGTARGA